MKTMRDLGDQPDGNPLRALSSIAKRRRELDTEEYLHVLQAREAGVTWQGIAAALGVSKQAVHKKFRGRTVR